MPQIDQSFTKPKSTTSTQMNVMMYNQGLTKSEGPNRNNVETKQANV